MPDTHPCAEFVLPKNGKYAAFCQRCHFSRTAHEHWDEWDDAAAWRAYSKEF